MSAVVSVYVNEGSQVTVSVQASGKQIIVCCKTGRGIEKTALPCSICVIYSFHKTSESTRQKLEGNLVLGGIQFPFLL